MTRRNGGAAPRLAIFIPSFGEGGVERMLVNIAGGLARSGVRVDFIVTRDSGPYLDSLDPGVERRVFAATDDEGLTAALTAYVREQRPAVVITGKGRDDRIALAVRERLPEVPTRYFLRVGTAVSGRARSKLAWPWARRRYRHYLRELYARCDGVLANAGAVADEISEAAGLDRAAVHVVPNPTVTDRLHALAAESPEHPWLRDDGPPVILGIGGLRRQKDFATLIRAFAAVRRQRAARLLILGRGRQERRLRRLARRLRVAGDVDLPGFAPNPYACLANAQLFVLSSLWEGLPNVLIEALAVGTPVVATDCPGGAAEILENGRLGELVAPGDWRAMAAAMARTLDDPGDAGARRASAARYTVEAATRAYRRALGFDPT